MLTFSAFSADPERGIGRAWHWLFAATLALPTAMTVLHHGHTARERLLTLALAGGFAGWHWFMLVRDGRWWGLRPVAVAYWVGAFAFCVPLVGLDGIFSVMAYGLYPLMFLTLGWWALAPVTLFVVAAGWRAGAGITDSVVVVNLLASLGLAVVYMLFIGALARQSEERLAALDALAATREELAEAARRAGALEERQRLARELHDTVAQGLTSIVTQLEAAEQAIDAQPDAAGRHIALARRTARDGLGEIRRSVRALRPDLLESGSLSQAIERTCRRWSADTGIPAEVRATGTVAALRPDVETALLRTAQEALANIAHHAGASRAVLTLSYLDDVVTLDVDDDGVGFDGAPRPPAGRGFGLTGMRERLAEVGGRLEVESAPGRGTTVAATVPA